MGIQRPKAAWWVAAGAATAILAGGLVSVVHGFAAGQPRHVVAIARVSPHPSPSPSLSPSPSPSPSPKPWPSALPVAPGAAGFPQTSTFPSHSDTAFRNAMTDLWLAVTTGNANLALPAFFPLGAYEKLKAIAYPESDWRYRLWADFVLDVHAVHPLVEHGARFVRVIVANQDAAWVAPGVCANLIGYWHMPEARVVYVRGGVERSFGIASLISWRGVWYVVHFGAVLRPYTVGMVDNPQTGTGYPGPAGGC